MNFFFLDTPTVDKITLTAISAVVFAFPIFFAPILADAFDLPKQLILVIGVSIAALAWFVSLTRRNKITLVRSNFDLPVLLFIGVSFISAFLAINKTISLTSDPLTYAFAGLLAFLVAQTISRQKDFHTLINLLLLSGAILVAWSGVEVIVGIVSIIIKSPILKLPFFAITFSLTGSYLTQAMVLAVILPVALGNFLKSKTKSAGFLLVLLVLGLVISAYTIYKNPLTLLSADSGWKIATGTIGRSVTSAFIGIGPANYVDAFTAFKPADFNATLNWNLRFTSGSNFYFPQTDTW